MYRQSGDGRLKKASFFLLVAGDEAPLLDVVEVFRHGEAGVEGLLVDAELLRAPLAQREDVVRPPVGGVPRFDNVALCEAKQQSHVRPTEKGESCGLVLNEPMSSMSSGSNSMYFFSSALSSAFLALTSSSRASLASLSSDSSLPLVEALSSEWRSSRFRLSTSTSSCSLLMMFVFCCITFDTARVS